MFYIKNMCLFINTYIFVMRKPRNVLKIKVNSRTLLNFKKEKKEKSYKLIMWPPKNVNTLKRIESTNDRYKLKINFVLTESKIVKKLFFFKMMPEQMHLGTKGCKIPKATVLFFFSSH